MFITLNLQNINQILLYYEEKNYKFGIILISSPISS
jgi:hypothetical protein